MLILCADDYALTEGISRAVGELAAARRLSATSVMVTARHWPAAGARLRVHRGRLAIGLHLNLTLGSPLGAMPRLAPGGNFPSRNALIARALLGATDPAEIAAEIERQLDAFEQGLGYSPITSMATSMSTCCRAFASLCSRSFHAATSVSAP